MLICAVVAAAAVGCAATAAADSIHLEASPSVPESHGKWTLTISGEALEPSIVDIGVVGGTEATCPGPSFFGQSLAEESVPQGPFSFTEAETANYAPEDACAYLVSGGVTTTSAGLVVHAIPSLEENEEAAARVISVKNLSVHVVNHYGRTAAAPGYTTIYVTASPYSYVTVRLTRFGHRIERLEWGKATTAPASKIDWTCSRPDGVYHYEVTARTNVGSTIIRRGRFTAGSTLRCRTLERREAEARERNERNFGEQARREAQVARERLEQWENNCRALGGSTVTIQTGEGPERACRSPRGGLLPVPI